MDINSLIFDAPCNVYWIDENNIYEGCNQQHAIMLGLRTCLEVIGRKYEEIPIFYSHPEIYKKLKENNAVVFNEAKSRLFEETLFLDGEERVFLSQKIPLLKDGKVTGLIGFSTDITKEKEEERKIYNENKERKIALRNIVANMPGHVYWKDVNGVYLGCNNLQAESLGMNYGYEVVGKTDFELPWEGNVAKEYRQNDLRIMKTGVPEVFEERSQMGGKPKIVLSHKAPLKDEKNKVFGVLGISLDITCQKEMEKQLRITKEKAESANKAKTEFLENMRHDFRTPFSGILGIAELMQLEEKDPKKKENLGYIIKSAESLLKQLNEIHEMLSLEEGTLLVSEKQFDLCETLSGIKEMFIPLAKDKNLEISIFFEDGLPKYVLGDKIRTQRILMNLINNALKFTEKGFVKISAFIGKIEKKKAIIKFKVEDSGIGVSEDAKEVIFEKFTRLSPSYKSLFPGKGLGLRIVKKFLDDLGGEIHLNSKINEGATFTILIPYKLPLLNCSESEL